MAAAAFTTSHSASVPIGVNGLFVKASTQAWLKVDYYLSTVQCVLNVFIYDFIG